jgi:hypothetical protein
VPGIGVVNAEVLGVSSNSCKKRTKIRGKKITLVNADSIRDTSMYYEVLWTAEKNILLQNYGVKKK